ncbi:AAA family ATPase [Oerskovia turbata]|uniref:AAA family ATPase n=1 Tax=Oerskovia turbata TaxID=1713 RepID=A0A4Q1KZU5_9CELL|nr:ATPase AAA [Oerskovia turbata]RXR28141.1 AAA family ATPase [Oerskovia turbata]RXR35827.1 AAA family ATPase [Oerskovia turbata]
MGVEQEVVDTLYARLDELRASTRSRLAGVRRSGPSGSPQNRSERDAFATLYEDRLAQLEAVEDRLAFGRLDLEDGATRYVGRIGLSDEEHTSILTDWRAPAAQSFYRATAAHPDGVRRRRHLVTQGRSVTGVEDEVLDLTSGAVAESSLSGEGALLAAMAAGRTSRMGDIVATIQAEQDAIIRSELTGALVVQGGPGTGKTAVALHRAAYLLYAHRRLLERSGVLLVGPSLSFLHYIDQVLPSLGETGVVSTTVAELLPGLVADGEEAPEVARIKGRSSWTRTVQRAVRARQRVPAEDQHLRIDGHDLVIRRSDVREAIAKAHRTHKPHNLARVPFVREMLGRLADQYVAQLGGPVAPEERAEVIDDLRHQREIRIALNLAWMPLTPERLIEDLFVKPHRLAEAAPDMSSADRAALVRPKGSPWTPADVPLLDEAAELLGEDDQAARAQAKAEAAERAASLDYARQVLESSGAGGGIVGAEVLADRFAGGGSRLTTAERAAQDRTWTYAHVVVDEAQELSAMAWRALVRRCPTRSMTIVGDVAQTSSLAGARSWSSMLDPLLRSSWRLATLTVNYRTPTQIADTAQRFAAAHRLPTSSLTSARDVPGALVLAPVPDGEDLLAEVTVRVRSALAEFVGPDGAGRVAVVAPAERVAGVREHLTRAHAVDPLLTGPGAQVEGALGAALTVLSPTQAKGLEFDAVVLLEPADVLAATSGASELYVAMTRPTQRLVVVHSRPLPRGLAD